jgi:two-component system, NarL family, sensor kinase
MHTDRIDYFIITTTAIIFLLATLIITLLFLYQKKQLSYQRNLEDIKLDFERNLLKTQVEIQEQTFQHISREIHDNINSSLTLAKLNLSTLNWDDSKKIKNSVETSIRILGAAIGNLSDLSKSMNTEMIRELGLMKAVRVELERVKEVLFLNIDYKIKGEPVFMECDKELVIFRIIQEAFNNIVKHANASQVWLELNYTDHFLDVLIKDNGEGFVKDDICNKIENGKSGLNNMQTRAKLFGGRVIVESMPNKGTQILVTVPYY